MASAYSYPTQSPSPGYQWTWNGTDWTQAPGGAIPQTAVSVPPFQPLGDPTLEQTVTSPFQPFDPFGVTPMPIDPGGRTLDTIGVGGSFPPEVGGSFPPLSPTLTPTDVGGSFDPTKLLTGIGVGSSPSGGPELIDPEDPNAFPGNPPIPGGGYQPVPPPAVPPVSPPPPQEFWEPQDPLLSGPRTPPGQEPPPPPAPTPGNPYVPTASPGDPTLTPPSATPIDPSGGLPGPGGQPPPSGPPGDPFFPVFTPPPVPTLDPFKTPPPFSFDPFAYDAFRAPSLTDAEAEPGYAFARNEGQRALQNAAAAKGVLRTGGSLKDLLKWGNQFAEQNYGNVYSRTADTYDRNRNNAYTNWAGNRENAANNYSLNYGIARDQWDRNTDLGFNTYDRNYKGSSDAFNSLFRGKELSFEDMYRRWRDLLNTQTQLALQPIPEA